MLKNLLRIIYNRITQKKTMIKTEIIYKECKYELVTADNIQINPVRGVDEIEANMIIEANFLIHKFHDFIRKYEEIQLNYEDYWRTIKRYKKLFTEDLAANRNALHNKEKSFIDINRAYNNYASSVKSFTELCRTKIKNQYGDQSRQHEEFQKIVSTIYDNHLSYRMILKTRDFALHAKFAIQQVQFKNKPKIKIKISFSRDLFLENPSMKKALKEDIKSFEPYFSVKPFIKEMPNLLETVLKNFASITKDEYEQAANIILKIEKEVKTDNVALNISDYSVYGEKTDNIIYIPVYMAKKYLTILT